MNQSSLSKSIGELVKEIPAAAKTLYFFGIPYQEVTEKTLDEACNQYGLSLAQVWHHLEKNTLSVANNEAQFSKLPLDLIIGFLKHSHHLFVKERLPYLSFLVEQAPVEAFENRQVGKDLKFIFPIFSADYIKHIWHEEDTLFTHIERLIQAEGNPESVHLLAALLDERSIFKYAADHQVQDDEMAGIRELTSNYRVNEDTDIRVRVLFAELLQFEEELKFHASVEDHVLFPKALSLENRLRFKMKDILPHN